jgi:hypothetical protein
MRRRSMAHTPGRLPEAIRTTLAVRGELLPGELAAAADLLQHAAPLLVSAVAVAPATAVSSPVGPHDLPTVSAVQSRRCQPSPPSANTTPAL